MGKHAAFCCVILGVALSLFCGRMYGQPAPAAERRWELLAHGSGNRLWYAVTTPPNSSAQVVTFVRQRTVPGDWEALTDFPARMIAMGDLGGQFVASLEGGEWKRISEDQFSTGLPLPGRGEILAMAGPEGTLYVVGFAEGARPEAATVPATSPTTRAVRTVVTTLPTTRPEQLQLYKFIDGAWKDIVALPVEVVTSRGRDLSLIILKGEPIVAFKDQGNIVQVLRLAAGATRWTSVGRMKPAFAVRKVKLMTARDKLIGWAAGENGVGSFFFPTSNGDAWREQPLSVSADVPVMDADVAAAGDELRLLVIRTGDERERFFEQKYNVNGQKEEKSLVELPPPKNSGDVTVGELVHWGLLGLLMVVTLATANRGGPVRIVKIDKLELALAPFSLRLAAGLIDLFPLYVGQLLIVHHLHNGMALAQISADRFVRIVIVTSVAIYLLHPLIGELIWGRSFGKMFVGLRVVGFDGKQPPLQALVLRNLMRIFDVLPLGFPLLVIFFNPLRQRVGDFTAGTLVTAKLPVKAEKAAEKESSTV